MGVLADVNWLPLCMWSTPLPSKDSVSKEPEKTRKEVCPALDNYGQSCFARSDFKKNEVCL